MGRGAGWAAGSSRVALMRLKQSAFKTTAQRGNQPEPCEGSKEMAGWVLTFPREREQVTSRISPRFLGSAVSALETVRHTWEVGVEAEQAVKGPQAHQTPNAGAPPPPSAP